MKIENINNSYRKMINYILSSSEEVFTTTELSNKFGKRKDLIWNLLEDTSGVYKCKVSSKGVYYGNKKSIESFKKHMGVK